MTGRRVRALLGALGMLSAVVCLGLPPESAAAESPEGGTSSAITVHGGGRFSDLAVSVTQTRDLVNQVVQVSWSGARPTEPASGQFQINYLQIMQCWGADPNGPDRTQCAFGGKAAFDRRGGDFSATRQVSYGSSLVDPRETIELEAGSTGVASVPFASVSGKSVLGNANQFYDSSTSNEVPFARTRADGTGEQPFEVATVRENSGLGCGAVVSGTPRGCWLVVVPRDDTEVDGSVRAATNVTQLASSPLSASNWAHRLVVPLSFSPVGSVCPLGAAERPTVGSELASGAMARWQPLLCTDGGPVYGYSQVGDQTARRQLKSPQPGFGFLTSAIPPDQVPATANMVYAPVTISGLTIAVNIESRAGPDASAALRLRDGRPITDIRLNQRLVAKLLTQSYRLGVDGSADYLQQNPEGLVEDPEFLQLNPGFRDLEFHGLGDIITQAGTSDETEILWRWLAADDEAMNFLAGEPDQWGMKVNPFYQGMSAPRGDFPKSDPYCRTFAQPGPTPLCTLDAHPYAGSLTDAAKAVGRGDSLARANWDATAIPPQYKRNPLQLSGQRALIAFTDTVSAVRFGLVPVRLRNSAGEYVAPSEASMTAAVAAMQDDETETQVLRPNTGSTDPIAYPLTMVTYGVTNAPALSAEDAADYATLIEYAAEDGQRRGTGPGELPDGYVPLTTELRAQAGLAADAIRKRVGPASPSPTVEASGSTSATPSRDSDDAKGGAVVGSSSGGLRGSVPVASTPRAGAPSGSPSPSPSAVETVAPVAQAVPTPADTMPAARVAIVVVAGLALAAAAAGPLIPRAVQFWTARRSH